jgi:uncharacterized protein YdeI (YjbR/CyaY-like superfamily)
MSDAPTYFASAAEWRNWLEQNHASAPEIWIGFHKASSSESGITNDEAVDQALCFGWIDGLVRGVDDRRWKKRFTPRKPGGHWSAVNVAKIERLTAAGLMHPAGVQTWEARREDRTAKASYEQKERATLGDYEAELRANPEAAAFWDAQPPGYRHQTAYWVTSAKQEETRRRRLAKLIELCVAGERR